MAWTSRLCSPAAGGPLAITSSRMGHLWDALCHAYDVLGFEAATGGDEVFRALVLARIIEPTSKADSLWVLEEVGVEAVSYPTVNRRLPVYAEDEWRQQLAAACAAHAELGPASLVQIPDGHISTQPWPAGPGDNRRDQTIYYQYRADRARRTLRGIDEQVAKAEKAVAGKVAVKRNRFIKLTGATKSVNRQLEAKARALAGLKGYVTNLDATAEFIIDAYHRLFQIEKAFACPSTTCAPGRSTTTSAPRSTRT